MPQDEVGVYHCFNRCVQQAFLCGFDRERNVDYSHRKVWMREKLRRLARAFAVDVFKYSLWVITSTCSFAIGRIWWPNGPTKS